MTAGPLGANRSPRKPPEFRLPAGLLTPEWALQVAASVCRDCEPKSVWMELASRTLAAALLLALEAAAKGGPDIEWTLIREELLANLSGLLERGGSGATLNLPLNVAGITFIASRQVSLQDRDAFVTAVCGDFRDMPAQMRASVIIRICATLQEAGIPWATSPGHPQ